MNSNKISQDTLSPQYWATDEDARIVNGHLRWSSWTQRRLLHIGVPLAGILAVFLPVALYASYGLDGVPALRTISSTEPELKITQEKIGAKANPSIIAPSNLDSSTSSSSQKTTVTVNGNNVAIPENGKVQKTIVDVSGTTTVTAESKSTQYSSGSSNENTNSFNINIQSSRSP